MTSSPPGGPALTVLTPESRGGVRAERYEDQVDWETDVRAGATAILFWIPRDMRTMPGMTTNVEFGLDVRTGRAVLGLPANCPNPERNRYLAYVARRHGAPMCETLDGTVTRALTLVAADLAFCRDSGGRNVLAEAEQEFTDHVIQ
ncbi:MULTISPECIES: nucleoside 2-deoxyribosyltransferase domain-containing protein [Streptomyces]|uniref:nucleoside 2-deoxyribosyltransferase domain-containing protein n=2 Tax=Streptomyces TaxID=1883 RepID=UPI001FF91C07|nr:MULTISPECIES: nucleoside 2-deoxyribosyltransferase domain-containing protein [Streptomyces]